MRRLVCMAVAGICMVAPIAARAQDSAANPVTAVVKELYDRQSKYIVDAAKEMPGDKYGYHPTPDQWTFGKIIAHVAGADFAVCSMISDLSAPKDFKVAETDPKDTLVAALQASFDFCSQALPKLQDSKMGDPITFFGGRKTTRARAVLELVADLADHYSQMASYLRLNGMLPPSAQPQK